VFCFVFVCLFVCDTVCVCVFVFPEGLGAVGVLLRVAEGATSGNERVCVHVCFILCVLADRMRDITCYVWMKLSTNYPNPHTHSHIIMPEK